MRELGCDRQIKTPNECVAIEPALSKARAVLAFLRSYRRGDQVLGPGAAGLSARAGAGGGHGCGLPGVDRDGG